MSTTSGDGKAAFGHLLRRFRGAAGLTQEALAERAGLSVRGISDLERGLNRAPQHETLRRLADALDLTEANRDALLAARHRAALAPQSLASARETAHNLPRELSSFVGRAADLVELERVLDTASMVTLVGIGGVGKTRLALRAARAATRRADDVYADGVWLVELADVVEVRLVPQRIATALGIGDDSRTTQLDTIEHVIRRRRMLVVLDNCEHLVEACAAVCERLLRASEGVRILATSREPLGVPGEVVFRVPPLAAPLADAEHRGIRNMAQTDAVRLFVERALAVQPQFTLDASNADSIAQVCRRVDGIPLAIELAAARLVALGPRDLATRLDNSFRILVSDKRTTPPRQRTLETTIAWSYGQLTSAEQDVFDRLAAFASITPDAAEAVFGAHVLDHIVRLATVSLVVPEPTEDGSMRYRMLVPVRQFGRERLRQRGLLHEAQQCHAEYFVGLVDAGPFSITSQPALMHRVMSELDNLRIAHDWLVATQQAGLALRLATSLQLMWNRPDLRSEGCARLMDVLALPDAERFALPFGRVVCGLGMISLMRSDMHTAAELLGRGLRLAERNYDAEFQSAALGGLGQLSLFTGDLQRAEALISQGLALARQINSTFLESRCLNGLADLALARGDVGGAEVLALAGVRLGEQTEDVFNRAMALTCLGDVQRSKGDPDRAADSYTRARELFLRLGGQGSAFHGLQHNMGYVLLEQGRPSAAAALFHEAAAAYERGGTDRRGIAECVLGLAAVAVKVGQPALAGRLIGAADATLEALGTTLSPGNRADSYRTRAAMHSALDEQACAAALALGSQLTLEDALAAARGLTDSRGAFDE